MKVALCISGHLRKFDQTFNSLYKSILSKYNPDIFIHTWDKLGFSCRFKTDSVLNETSTKLSLINKLYNPKKLIIESSDFVETLKQEGNKYAPHLINEPKHVGHMSSMFYKIYACNAIRKNFELENNISYDWIIRCRPDLLFHEKVDIPANKQENTIWLPQFICNAGWYTDQFAIADSDSMDLYSSIYFDLPEYFNKKMEYYPEKFVFWALNEKNLKVDFLNTKFEILR